MFQVKLDLTKTYKHRRVDPKIAAKPPLETFSRKRAEHKKMLEKKSVKEMSGKMNTVSSGEVSFSNEKIEHMKKLAQMLSQKVVQNTSPNISNSVVETKSNEDNSEDVQAIDDGDDDETLVNKIDFSLPSNNNDSPTMTMDRETQKTTNKTQTRTILDGTEPNCNNVSEAFAHGCDNNNKTYKHKSKHKGKKKKKRKDAEFEGKRVPHLVKAGTSTADPKKESPEDDKKYATQDEYVLLKLFAKSGGIFCLSYQIFALRTI